MTSPAGQQQDRPATVLGPFHTITEEEVLQQANKYQRFRQPDYAPDTEILNLPTFERITQYGCDSDLQSGPWAQEVASLVTDGRQGRQASRVSWLARNDGGRFEGFSPQVLGTLSDIVFQGLQIVIYDNERVLAEHASELCDTDMMSRCHDNLKYLGTSSQEDGILTYDSKTLLFYKDDIFELINLWVAVVARVICRSAEKKSIVIQTLALLATVAAKLKVVCTNLRKFAQISVKIVLDNHSQPAQISVGDYPPYRLLRTANGNVRTANARPGIGMSKKDALRAMYMRQCSDLRARVLKIMFNHLLKLRGNEVLQVRTLAKYEISAMVHEIGFDRVRTLVFQDQNTHFTGTAQPYTVSCISQALYDINAVVKRLERDETTAPQPANTAPSPTSVADTADDTSIGTRIASSYILEKDKVARPSTPWVWPASSSPISTRRNSTSIPPRSI